MVALAWANSPWSGSYFHLWHTDPTFGFAGSLLSKPLHFWINDGLMALFFLLVGLEIKRETLVGELASFRKAALPIAAALGGMIVPAVLYFLFNRGGPGASGWGIPMATDIAFALGVLALLGDRVPTSLKVFLAALAIADDIGAVLVIAFFYTAQISWISLGVGGLFFVALIAANRTGARHPLTYVVLGLGLWIAFLQSGIHATVAGVLLAITIPARQRVNSLNAESPMLRFEHALMPWNKYVIMPVFALANAGVILGTGAARSLADPISVGVICGLVLGKPIGIVLFSWLATRSRIAAMLDGIGWRQIAWRWIAGRNRLHHVALHRQSGFWRHTRARDGEGGHSGGFGFVRSLWRAHSRKGQHRRIASARRRFAVRAAPGTSAVPAWDQGPIPRPRRFRHACDQGRLSAHAVGPLQFMNRHEWFGSRRSEHLTKLYEKCRRSCSCRGHAGLRISFRKTTQVGRQERASGSWLAAPADKRAGTPGLLSAAGR